MSSKPARILYWHRTDLRVSDSPALHTALSIPNIQAFYPFWCFDPSYVYDHLVGLNRWSFLLESMSDLSDHYTKLNPKQKLHVVRGRVNEVLTLLWEEWGITHLIFEKDSNGYAKERDEMVEKLGKEKGVEILGVHGRHLFDPMEVGKRNKGQPTMTLNHWKNVCLPCLLFQI